MTSLFSFELKNSVCIFIQLNVCARSKLLLNIFFCQLHDHPSQCRSSRVCGRAKGTTAGRPGNTGVTNAHASTATSTAPRSYVVSTLFVCDVICASRCFTFLYTVLVLSKLKKINATAPQPQRNVLKYFAIIKNVAHMLEPGETPSYSASHQDPNYVQRS